MKENGVEITISYAGYAGYARCSTPDCDAPVDPKPPPAVTLDRVDPTPTDSSHNDDGRS